MHARSRSGRDAPARGAHALVHVSPTRWRILEALRARPRTVGELARRLDVDRSGVHRHVLDLEAAGLLERRAGPRKWVYNALTEDGARLMDRVRALLDEPPRGER